MVWCGACSRRVARGGWRAAARERCAALAERLLADDLETFSGSFSRAVDVVAFGDYLDVVEARAPVMTRRARICSLTPPLTEVTVAGDVVETPMDLGTVRAKLRRGEYKEPDEARE